MNDERFNGSDTTPEPSYPYLNVGTYGGLDDRHKTRKTKRALGFSGQPKRPAKPSTKR